MDIAKSETFKNFIILNKALLFLIIWNLPSTNTHRAHLGNQFNHGFALLIFMQHFKSINLIKIDPKLSYFYLK